ncbi:cyclopropane fatty acyl phospholipid synthase [Ferruginibacter paludis]|uniref:cyclopropane fatty acyl phospholipid synthase n=1 Tax=Ferruginibacter paludis TaxID=1310417 RepID=UPI0025B54540|nr:cyclopropane fatty acyl phospholipid synthase [Ferruginibacter paludis]MDN3654232.1 cyclopropane fatty acyl phospholipid synthase [Ferruginibacter paludis]
MNRTLPSAQTKYQTLVTRLLDTAGVKIGGPNPWDIQVHNDGFYKRVLADGETGMGESYMDGWWDAERVDELICKILQADLDNKISLHWPELWRVTKLRLLNLQTKKMAFVNGQKHYDLGNDLFQAMLDSRMNYSCGYWKNASCLCQAQENKLDLICRKLYLKPGMRVLDIGCGWGAFGKFAAEKYGVKVVGITVSKEQMKLGQQLCGGLNVEFRMMDYRNTTGQYDRVVSVGMLEHVGYKNYRSFFETCCRCLTDGGLFLLHTIGSNHSVRSINGWTNKYIFPNAMLPSLSQLSVATEGLFIAEDLHNFGTYYDDTLMAWYHNFKNNWHQIEKDYPSPFFRMWEYYLLSSAGGFRARKMQLWQIVLSKYGVAGGYESVR